MFVQVVVPVEGELVVANGQVPLDLVHVVVDDLAVVLVIMLVMIFPSFVSAHVNVLLTGAMAVAVTVAMPVALQSVIVT